VNFLTYLRRFRRISVGMTVGLIVLQSVLAGLTTAHAAVLAANPFAGAICHGSGNSDPADGTVPENDIAALCCGFCTVVATAVTSGDAPTVVFFRLGVGAATPIPCQAIFPRDARAVRAGPSQAPPSSST
jgi:hypothetical protein